LPSGPPMKVSACVTLTFLVLPIELNSIQRQNKENPNVPKCIHLSFLARIHQRDDCQLKLPNLAKEFL